MRASLTFTGNALRLAGRGHPGGELLLGQAAHDAHTAGGPFQSSASDEDHW